MKVLVQLFAFKKPSKTILTWLKLEISHQNALINSNTRLPLVRLVVFLFSGAVKLSLVLWLTVKRSL